MNNKEISELLERVEAFNDNGVIISHLMQIAGYLDCDSESSGDAYWIQEAICNLDGMFGLIMDLKKSHEVESESRKNP